MVLFALRSGNIVVAQLLLYSANTKVQGQGLGGLVRLGLSLGSVAVGWMDTLRKAWSLEKCCYVGMANAAVQFLSSKLFCAVFENTTLRPMINPNTNGGCRVRRFRTAVYGETGHCGRWKFCFFEVLQASEERNETEGAKGRFRLVELVRHSTM